MPIETKVYGVKYDDSLHVKGVFDECRLILPLLSSPSLFDLIHYPTNWVLERGSDGNIRIKNIDSFTITKLGDKTVISLES